MERIPPLPGLSADRAPAARAMPLRWHLAVLTVAVLAPMLVLSLLLIVWNAGSQRRAAEDDLREMARSLAFTVDQDIAAITGTLEAVAIGGGFPGDNPVGFHTTAAMLQERHPHWHSVFLASAYGRIVMDTAVGAPGPESAPYAATVRKAIVTGRPVVSALLPAADERPPLAAVAVPLRRHGLIETVIGVTVRAERWTDMLRAQQFPDDLVAVVVDGDGRILARAPEPDRYVGRTVPDWYRDGVATAMDGVVGGFSLMGSDLTMGFRHMNEAGWTVGLGVPDDRLQASVRRSLWAMTGLGAALIALAAFGAIRYGRRIAAPIRRLSEAAAALDDGRPVPAPKPGAVSELNDLATVLALAGERLHAATAEREQLLIEEARGRREAELANGAKARFLAAASHDLRQPFQAMRLYHYLLNESLAGERDRDNLARLGRAMESGEALLNALLDVSTLEAGTVRPQVTDVPLDDILDAKLGEVRGLALEKGLEIRFRPCRETVRSDPMLLGRIVGNLLANAVRYTNAGGILLACRRRRGHLRIEVWDTGIGIPLDKLSAVFEDFVQLDNSARDHRQGLGLGLSVVQRTAHLLGHPLTVRSRPGRGSLFAVTVPLTASDGTRAAPCRPSVQRLGYGRSLRILLVEDHADQRAALRRILEDAGHRVTSAADGPSALAAVEKLDERPDAVVSDYRLPGPHNGAELVALVAQRVGRPLPGIIVTGDTDPERLRDAARSGCILLHKPIAPADLQEVVAAAAMESETGLPVPLPA